MAETETWKRRIVEGRSPPFPFIPLEKAVEQARRLERHTKGHMVRVATAVEAWGYKPGSSGGRQTIAALKAFGLLADGGSGEDRKVQITDFAKRLLLGPPPEAERRMLQEAALKPNLIKDLWGRWGATRPPESQCRYELVMERGFTAAAAATFVGVYDATVAFAGLTKSDSVPDAGGVAAEPTQREEEREIAPGDLVQWLSQDAWQFEHPRHVLDIIDNPDWGKSASVEGYAGELPLEQLTLAETMVDTISTPNTIAPAAEANGQRPAPQPLIRRHVFSLDNGHAALELPTNLTADVLEDVKAWLVVLIRRAGKTAAPEGAPATGAGGRDLIEQVFLQQEPRVTN